MNASADPLRKQIKFLRIISLTSVLLTVGLAIYVLVSDVQSSKVLVTQGIVIEDANGNDRILIGTPIPFSPDRVRTDSAKAWETYVERWPENMHEKIWGWYKNYYHSTNGIIFLSESGHDRIALGDPAPDPTIGKRIAPSTGLILMDENGSERSGYGIMKMEEDQYRITLGLDSKQGTEGVVVALDDIDGRNGLIVPGVHRTIYLGNVDSTYWATKPHPKFNGLIIRNKDSLFVDIQ